MEIKIISDKNFTKYIKTLNTKIENKLKSELKTSFLILPHWLSIQNYFLSLCHYENYLDENSNIKFFDSEFKNAYKNTFIEYYNRYLLENIKDKQK